jgi:hypothetical protein
MRKSYERQHLAAYAAGYINDSGTTQVTFGCQMTRVGLGTYAVVLPDDANLLDNESFTFVTIKGSVPLYKMVTDTSNRVKTVNVNEISAVGTGVDSDIEVVLFRSVTR